MIYNVFVAYLLIISIISLSKIRIPRGVFVVNAVFTIYLFGFRSYDIGSADTLNYVTYFLGMPSAYDYRSVEIGFKVFNKVLHLFLPYGWMYLLVVDFVALFPVYKLVSKYSTNVHVSLLAFYCVFRVYEVYMVCTRQVVAMGFIFWAIYLFSKDAKHKIRLFILLCFIGFTIHGSVLLIAIFYLLMLKIKITRKTYLVVCLVSMGVCVLGVFRSFEPLMVLFNMFGSSVLGRFEGYLFYNFSEQAFYLHPTIRTLVGIVFCFVAKDEHFESVFAKLYLVAIVISDCFSQFLQNYRFAGMFTPFGLIVLSWTFSGLLSNSELYKVNKFFREYGAVVRKFMLVGLLFVVLYSFSNFKYINDDLTVSGPKTAVKLNPYHFFWDDNHDF